MSDDGSVICVDKDGNPIVEEGRPSASLRSNLATNSLGASHKKNVIVIDDDSSVETTLFIGTMGRKKKSKEAVRLEMNDDDEEEKKDGGLDESSLRPEEMEQGTKDGCENPVRLTASAIAKNCERIAQGEVICTEVSDETSGTGLAVLEDSGEKKAATNSSCMDDASRESVKNTSRTPKETTITRKSDRVDAAPKDDVAPSRKRKNRPNRRRRARARATSKRSRRTNLAYTRNEHELTVASLPQSKTVTTTAERQVCEDSLSDEGILEERNNKKFDKNSRRAEKSGDGAKDAKEINVVNLLTLEARERSMSPDESNDSSTHNDVASLDHEKAWKPAAAQRMRNASSAQTESDEATSNEATRFRSRRNRRRDRRNLLKQQDSSVIGNHGLPPVPIQTAAPKLKARPSAKSKSDEIFEISDISGFWTSEASESSISPDESHDSVARCTRNEHELTGPEVASLPQSKNVTTAAERQVCEDSLSDKGILEERNNTKIDKNSWRAEKLGDGAKDAKEINVVNLLTLEARERSISPDESNASSTHNDVASLDHEKTWKASAPNGMRNVSSSRTESSEAKSNEATPFEYKRNLLRQQDKRVIGKHGSPPFPMKKAASQLKGKALELDKSDKITKVTSSLYLRSRVYAKWTNAEYFWGTITAISNEYFSILFDDGDYLEKVGKKDISTKNYMLAALGKTPPPLDRKTAKLVEKFISGNASTNDMKGPNAGRNLTVAGMKGICGRCENCRKEPCGLCAWCRSDGDRCFQKMCYEMPVDAKAEPAVGFPPGWRFYFAEAYQSDTRSRYETIPCLWILSPGGRICRSVEAAASFFKFQNGEMIAHEFYDYVGLPQKGKRARSKNRSKRSSGDKEDKATESRPRRRQTAKKSSARQTKTSTDHPLVGRSFCLKWMGLNKQRKVIYGRVTDFEYHTRNRDIISFKVTFNDEMREVLNRIDTLCGSKIQFFQMFDPIWTWGGCVLAEQENQSASERSSLMRHLPPIYYSWLIPDVSIHSVTENDGARLPRLIVFYRCCRLQFDVKKSRIANGGNGVFLSCTRDDGKTDSFKLQIGELLDLGIYAPLRTEDLKIEPIFLVKNFIHHYKIEDYAFRGVDNHFHLDISDDVSGDLHAEAKSQIFPFVNETVDDLSVTVRPTPDPEGFFHFHLGHSTKGQGDFEMPTDGKSEIELYANYGHEYEKVRIRKGYSTLSEEDRAGVLELQDAGYLEEMDEFEESDVRACVDFLSMLFSAQSEIAPEVRQRALTCAVVLQRRAYNLLHPNGGDKVNKTEVCRNARNLITLLLRNDELEELHFHGNCEEVLRRVFERHAFSEVALPEVAYMLE